MDIIKKMREILPKNTFPTKNIKVYANDKVEITPYPNYLIIQPLSLEVEREILKNPYTRLLKSKKHLFAIFYFPSAVQSETEFQKIKNEWDHKYTSRLENLLKAREEKAVRLITNIVLPAKEMLKLQYVAKPYNKSKDHDFQDDSHDTMCATLTKPQTPYIEINRVSTTYNTFLILQNAKEVGNSALIRYRKNAKQFYSDIVINYILEHSGLLAPNTFKYTKESYEIRLPVKELFKLFPHRTFKLQLPEGVNIDYIKAPRLTPSQKPSRLSKNDTAIFTFTNDFLAKFRSIIEKADINFANPESFMKFPIWFLLEALKSENLTSRGFYFLLWFLPYYRMKSPKLFHNVRTILEETGADLKHGYKKPISTLTSYFNYLIKCKMLVNVESPLDLANLKLDSPPKKAVIVGSTDIKELFITLQKPKKPQN